MIEGRPPVEFGYLAGGDSLDIDQGDKEVEFIPSLQGGRIPKFNPEAETTMTMDVYPTSMDSIVTPPTGIIDIFNGSRITSVQTCEVAANWTSSGTVASTSLNSTTYKYGSGAINLIETTPGADTFTAVISSTNMTGKQLYLWLYILDLTKLDIDPVSNMFIKIGDSGLSNNNTYYIGDRVQEGWNLIRIDMADPRDAGNGTSSTNIGAVVNIQLGCTVNAGHALTAGDLIMDYWHTTDETDPIEGLGSSTKHKVKFAFLASAEPDLESLTVTSVTDSTLTVTEDTFTIDERIGQRIVMTSGTAKGKEYIITDNTKTILYSAGSRMVHDGVTGLDKFKVVPTGWGCVGSNYEAYRLYYLEGYITSCKSSFTDGILKTTISLKLTPRNRAGTQMFGVQSTVTTTITSLGWY
jgi:hypothetical protein